MANNLDIQTNNWMKLFDPAMRGNVSSQDKIIPAVTLLVTVVVVAFLVRPLFLSVLGSQSELNSKNAEYEKLVKKETILKRLNDDEELSVLSKRLEYMNKYVPGIKPSLQTLIHVSRLSRLKNIQFSGMTLNPGTVKSRDLGGRKSEQDKEGQKRTSGKKALSSFAVEFSIIGEKDDLLDYVSKLNEISPLMKVEHFTTSIVQSQKKPDQDLAEVTTQPKFDANTQLQASLTLSVYYLEDSGSLPEINDVSAVVLTPEEEKFLLEIEQYLFQDPQFANADDVLIEAPLGKQNPFTEPRGVQASRDVGNLAKVLVVGKEATGSSQTR